MTINTEIFQWIHAGAGTRPLVDFIATFFAESGPYIPAALFVILWFLVGKDKKIAMLEATEAAGVGLGINQLVGLFYFHPRPFMIGLCTPLFPHVPENSFPSDHATLMFSIALYLLLFRGWVSCGLVLLTVAILTAWGRVYVGIHFPLDMVGSFFIAFVATGLIFRLAGHFPEVNKKISQFIDRLLRNNIVSYF